MKRPRWQVNENHLLIAYFLMAFLCGGALALLQTDWRRPGTLFFSATLQYPAEYAHACGLIFLLALAALMFFRGRAIQVHRQLGYPYWASAIGNAVVVGMTVWVGARGVDARLFVMQDYYLVAVVFVAAVAALTVDLVAWRSRIPTIGKSHLVLSIIAACLHIAAVAGVVVATINLEFTDLSGFVPIQ